MVNKSKDEIKDELSEYLASASADDKSVFEVLLQLELVAKVGDENDRKDKDVNAFVDDFSSLSYNDIDDVLESLYGANIDAERDD